MKSEPDRLYNLLPVIHRMRDAEQGYPLRALLQVISEQVNLVEADIARLYDNMFIETCEDWVVPYIGELVGYRVVHEAGEPGDALTSGARNKIVIPRRDVADTIRNRRRKGALALLEELAMDTAGWPSRAVEFFRLLGWTQHLNHPQPQRVGTVDVRRVDALDRLNGAFEESAHMVDVRRVNARRTTGRYNIPGVGLFVWRIKAYPVTRAPARLEDRQRHQYTFSILGNDTPLFTKTIDEPSSTHVADDMNVPTPIRRRGLEERPADYYGEGKSFVIYRDTPNTAVPVEDIVVADLTGWAYQPTGHQVAVDPKLGRIAFSSRRPPQKGVWVSYHYGFSADIGGGEYVRRVRSWPYVIRVGEGQEFKRISDALARWREYRRQSKWPSVVIEITDSSYYTEQIAIELYRGERLELRAASGKRPVIRLLDFAANQPDAIQVVGYDREFIDGSEGEPEEKHEEGDCDAKRAGRLILDGLLISGRGLQVTGNLESVTIRHSTLVPGWSLDRRCNPEYGTEASIELVDTMARVKIEHSIVGTIQVIQNEVISDPLSITITDSVLDATSPELEALGSPECPVAHVLLTIKRTTVIGRVAVHAIDLAENSIFDGVVRVARRQIGCMRFCYTAPESRTPRRFNCQPDLVVGAATTDAAKASETLRVRPQFNSRRYGKPDYCQLADICADEIKRGADDESEMGVFHDLFQPQREANLRARLTEFTPARMDVGIIFKS